MTRTGMKRDGQTLRVGLLVLVALVVLAAGIFLIGDKSNLFRSTHHYVVRFQTVGGLQAGGPVQLNGVDVGRIKDVVLPRDPAAQGLEVHLTIDERYAQRVREGSRARIKTLGLLGDKFIEITSGQPGEPEIPDGGEILPAEATDVDELIASGEDVVENILKISYTLNQLLERMERGEGILGELLGPRPEGEPSLNDSLNRVLASVEGFAESARSGDGALPLLLNDKQLADRLSRSVSRIESLLTALEEGDGLAPSLLHDPELKARFERVLTNLETSTARLAEAASALEEGDGLLPRLLHDEAFGKEVTDELRQLLERFNSVAGKITEGDGTLGKLIEDSTIYEALNDVIVGINESKLLRWLIRNRQKAGIRERYEDAGGPRPAPEASEPLDADPGGGDLPSEPDDPYPPRPSERNAGRSPA